MALAIARHFRPRRSVPRYISKETRTDVSWIESLLSESIKLNQQARTFSRATSAWDPKYNCIQPPGVARQRPIRYLDRYTILADLIEGAGTNLLAAGSSDDFTNAAWVNSNQISAVNKAALAPDGELLMSSLTRTSTSLNNYSLQNTNFTAGTTYTLSIYAKAKSTGNQIGIRLQSTYPARIDLVANLATGVIRGSDQVTWTNLNSGIQAIGNGVYRIWITGTADATVAGVVVVAPTDATIPVAGFEGASAVLSNCYVWGAQLEVGAFPTSYISNRNLQTQTQRYDNATWTKTDTTITQAAITGPLSGLTDGQLVAEGVAGTGALLNIGVLVTASGAYSTSAYFKRGNHDFILLQASNGAITSGFRQWFNINLGTAGTSQAFGTGTFTGGTITNVGGGWYRISISGTIGAFTSFVQTSQSASADASATRVNNAQRYMYGSQTEPGTTATAYWGVNGTVGGRDADNLTVNLAGLPGGSLSTTIGTVLALACPLSRSGIAPVGTDLAHQGGTPFAMDLGGSFYRDLTNGSQPQTETAGVVKAFGITWNASIVAEYSSGALVASRAGQATYSTVTSFTVGNLPGLTQPYGGYVALITEARDWTALEHSLVGTASLSAP